MCHRSLQFSARTLRDWVNIWARPKRQKSFRENQKEEAKLSEHAMMMSLRLINSSLLHSRQLTSCQPTIEDNNEGKLTSSSFRQNCMKMGFLKNLNQKLKTEQDFWFF